jgi:hypothetical protein
MITATHTQHTHTAHTHGAHTSQPHTQPHNFCCAGSHYSPYGETGLPVSDSEKNTQEFIPVIGILLDLARGMLLHDTTVMMSFVVDTNQLS